MVKKFSGFLVLFLLASTPVFSQEAGELSLDTWITENVGTSGTYPFSIIVLESDYADKGSPVFANVSNEELEQISYFKPVDTSSLAWDLKINFKKSEGLSGREVLESLTSASYYLFVPKVGNVVFARRTANGKIEEMFSAKAKSESNWGAIFSWIQKRFGWDGIILASSKNKFIVGAPARLLKEPDIQALAISGSKETEILEKGDRTGAGLLSLVKKYNGFGLFEAIFVDEKVGIEVGTKLIIERRRK